MKEAHSPFSLGESGVDLSGYLLTPESSINATDIKRIRGIIAASVGISSALIPSLARAAELQDVPGIELNSTLDQPNSSAESKISLIPADQYAEQVNAYYHQIETGETNGIPLSAYQGQLTQKEDGTFVISPDIYPLMPQVHEETPTQAVYNKETGNVDMVTQRVRHTELRYSVETTGETPLRFLPVVRMNGESLTPHLENDEIIYWDSNKNSQYKLGPLENFLDDKYYGDPVTSEKAVYLVEDAGGIGGLGKDLTSGNIEEQLESVPVQTEIGNTLITFQIGGIETTISFPQNDIPFTLPQDGTAVYNQENGESTIEFKLATGETYSIYDLKSNEWVINATAPTGGNLRTGPGTSFDKAGALEVGQQVGIKLRSVEKDTLEVNNETGFWNQIDTEDETEKWVYGPLITFTNSEINAEDVPIEKGNAEDALSIEYKPKVENVGTEPSVTSIPSPTANVLTKFGIEDVASLEYQMAYPSEGKEVVRAYQNGEVVLVAEQNKDGAWEWKEAAFEGVPNPDEKIVEKAISSFKEAMNIGENSIEVQYAAVTGRDGQKYIIGSTFFDADPSRQGEILEGMFPLVIATQDEKGEWKWESTTPANIFGTLGIKIGVNIDQNYSLNSQHTGILDKGFSRATVTQGDLLWKWVEATQGKYEDWGTKDMTKVVSRVNLIDDKREITAQHILWPSNYPDWLKNGNVDLLPGESQRDAYIRVMKGRIGIMAERYRDTFDRWVIVNEPGDRNWRQDILLDVIGPEYIMMAYDHARELLGDDVVLIYNDLANQSTSGDMKNRWYTDLTLSNLELLEGKIDIVGMQMHIDASVPPSKEEIISLMRTYAQYTRKNAVEITEMDVDISDITGESREMVQAEIYKTILDAALESGVCTGIAFWDIGDNNSWLEKYMGLPNADATLFDQDLKPKAAYYAVLQSALQHLLKQ